MNCRYAQEIINTLIDGESHPLAAEARQHANECDSCREWQSSMERTLGLIADSEPPPMPDIAAMVMSRLPAQHPAARPAAFSPGKALAWLAAAWLLGMVMGAGLLIAILPDVSVARLAEAIGITKSVLAPMSTILAAIQTAFAAVGQGALSIIMAIGLGPTIAVPLVIDLVLLLVILLVWYRRQLISNAILV